MSPLGVGTDIGGSIRVPAHFTGIAGLKPTLDRWPNHGVTSALSGQEAVRGQTGPMARSARDLRLLLEGLDPRRMSALDPRVPPLPFEDPSRVDISKIRVGFFIEDSFIPASNAVARAVTQAASALRGVCASVTHFTPPGIDEAIHAYFGALSADAGEGVGALLKEGEVDVVLKSMRATAGLSDGLRRAAAKALGLVGEARLRRLVEVMGKKSVHEYWRITAALRKARMDILAAMDAEGVDVILCPPFATPALPHTLSREFALAASSSMIWNVVQFPAGVVPVTRVRASETHRVETRDRLERRAAEIDRQSAGLPVGVQVVGKPWAESVVVAVMQAIEEAPGILREPDRPVVPFLAA
jgi:fatty acid amide hydrolase